MFEQFFSQPTHKLLCEAISKSVSPITVIVGSGLSRAANLPDWNGLRKKIQLSLDNDYTTKTAIDTRFSDPRYKQASKTENYWAFFQTAKDLLGEATFNGIITNALYSADCDVPESYRHLLNLNPRGVITLNLDGLTGQVFSEHYSSQAVIPVYGFDIAKKWQIINDEKSYLVYLHGHISDPNTWILTQSDLNKIQSSGGRDLFLSQVYLNNTVIFAGLSADDVAISSTLLRLKQDGFSPPRLFWVTTRRDAASDQWAKDNFVQKIMYAAKNDEEHAKFFFEFVDDIKKYSSQDVTRIPPQMVGARIFDQDIKSQDPREIANLDCEQVRKTLSNILLEKISEDNGKDTYDKFDEFVQKYRYPIQTKSFYKDSAPPDNVFFGYEVIFPALGTGNFGEAYQAKRPDENIVCLKIMHSNLVSNREMIGGFRRGIRSMEILRKHSVDGVVKIIESFEMPPTIVMDIAPGNSLQEIFYNLKEFPWNKKLEIICSIGSIVDECHKLPEMVLHRDIKPSNVMLEGLDYSDYSFIKLYVLDFDMSWHKNSSEKDIIFESRDDFGYLAPEQTDPSRRTTTRSAKVDSYGLAMTAFAVFGGAHPVPGWTMSQDWPSKVHQIARSGYNANWKCLPRRLSRALIEATAVAQDVRLDFSSFWRRLLKIKIAASSSGVNQPVDLIAEEILAQIAVGREYVWDDIVDKGSFQFVNGAKIEVSVDDNQHSITIYVGFSDQGSSQFKSRNQLMGEARDLMEQAAKQFSAKVKRVNLNHGMLDFHISINFNGSLNFANSVATVIIPALDKLLKIQ